ncbi:MAG: DUF3696 domain-containing protein [Roseivirga sp.]
MIKSTSLEGFKSFLDTTIEFGGLTILTGLNSSGKSSVIQALLIAAKAFRNENRVLLEGHGSIEEIQNTYHSSNLRILVEDQAGRSTLTEFDREAKTNKNYSCHTGDQFTFPEIFHISAHRFGPKTSMPIFNDSFNRQRIGANGENLFQFIQSFEEYSLDSRLRHESSEGDTLEYNIRGWLNVISPNTKFRFVIDKNSDTSYSMFDEHRATNVGFGLSYALPVIATLLIGTLVPNSLVIIENPEAHLHPKGQTEMARLISLCSQVGTQIIVETHSDHLFDGIRVFTKRNKGFSDNVQIHWFELDERRNTVIYSPNMDENGRLDSWPIGLFDQFEMNASELI